MSMPNTSRELRKLVKKISDSKDKRKQYLFITRWGSFNERSLTKEDLDDNLH